MDKTEAEIFRQRGKQMIDYAAEYLTTVGTRSPMPEVKPGFLRPLLPNHAPEEAEQWDDVMNDVDKIIMPGVVHCNAPNFHAIFPFTTSHPAICADILSDAVNCNGMTWGYSPVCTELEVIVMDWLGKLLQLPDDFLACSGGKGGGVIQVSACESTLLCMLAARNNAIDHQLKLLSDQVEQPSRYSIWEKLVAYTSDQAHTSVERAGLFAGIHVRSLSADDKCALRGNALEEAIAKDKADGKIPFMVISTLGTTSSVAFDNLLEIGPIAQREGLWMHIDAAYAGAAFICPEFRPLLNGVEYADSFNFNPHKWMLVTFDCSALWLKDSDKLTKPFFVNKSYLTNVKSDDLMPDFKDWQFHLSRRFRSLKLWFVLRLFGAKYLREHIRKYVVFAKEFEALVNTDQRFEIVYPVVMGLVCFRFKGANEPTEQLFERLLAGRKLLVSQTTIKGKYFIRFVICSQFIQSADLIFAWDEIRAIANQLQSATG